MIFTEGSSVRTVSRFQMQFQQLYIKKQQTGPHNFHHKSVNSDFNFHSLIKAITKTFNIWVRLCPHLKGNPFKLIHSPSGPTKSVSFLNLKEAKTNTLPQYQVYLLQYLAHKIHILKHLNPGLVLVINVLVHQQNQNSQFKILNQV